MKFLVEKFYFVSALSLLMLVFIPASQKCALAQQQTPSQSGQPNLKTPIKTSALRSVTQRRTSRIKNPPAQPPVSAAATVLLSNGSLQVKANNSDLSQILTQVAADGGMTIDGSVPNVKVYGTYGPADSRQVLTDLLTGLGYNFVMVGTTSSGVPSRLLLTARSNQISPSPPTVYVPPSRNITPPETSASEDQPGPGAIVNVPPAGSDDPQERAQQNLQRLQQMHDQQSKPMQPQ